MRTGSPEKGVDYVEKQYNAGKITKDDATSILRSMDIAITAADLQEKMMEAKRNR